MVLVGVCQWWCGMDGVGCTGDGEKVVVLWWGTDVIVYDD